MGDYGLFDDVAEQEAKLTRQASAEQDSLNEAIFEAKRRYSSFVSNSKDEEEFKTRIAYLGNDVHTLVAEFVKPTPAVMRKVRAALKPIFAAGGFPSQLERKHVNDGTSDYHTLHTDANRASEFLKGGNADPSEHEAAAGLHDMAANAATSATARKEHQDKAAYHRGLSKSGNVAKIASTPKDQRGLNTPHVTGVDYPRYRDAAENASEKANNSNNPKDHEAAFYKHMQAFWHAPDNKTKEYHNTQANNHWDTASHLTTFKDHEASSKTASQIEVESAKASWENKHPNIHTLESPEHDVYSTVVSKVDGKHSYDVTDKTAKNNYGHGLMDTLDAAKKKAEYYHNKQIKLKRQWNSSKTASTRLAWTYDRKQNVYSAKGLDNQKFACPTCSTEHDLGYSRCNCGKVWNSWPVKSAGDDKTASGVTLFCREVNERPAILASTKESSGMDDYDNMIREIHDRQEKENPSEPYSKHGLGISTPEYHRAANTADALSGKASASGKYEDHDAARKAHAHAAELAGEEWAGAEAQGYHHEMAGIHRNRMDSIGKGAKVAADDDKKFPWDKDDDSDKKDDSDSDDDKKDSDDDKKSDDDKDSKDKDSKDNDKKDDDKSKESSVKTASESGRILADRFGNGGKEKYSDVANAATDAGRIAHSTKGDSMDHYWAGSLHDRAANLAPSAQKAKDHHTIAGYHFKQWNKGEFGPLKSSVVNNSIGSDADFELGWKSAQAGIDLPAKTASVSKDWYEGYIAALTVIADPTSDPDGFIIPGEAPSKPQDEDEWKREQEDYANVEDMNNDAKSDEDPANPVPFTNSSKVAFAATYPEARQEAEESSKRAKTTGLAIHHLFAADAHMNALTKLPGGVWGTNDAAARHAQKYVYHKTMSKKPDNWRAPEAD